MDIFQHLVMGFGVALTLKNLFFCFIGVFIGTLIGVLPGIGPVATISLLLPITFGMDPVTSIIMLAGIYYGAQYGGSTTSILVNIPGEASSIVTCLDGYKMARQGRAGPALGIAAFGSFIGGTASIFGLMLLAPVLARAALRFGPPEYFCLMLFGLTMVTYLCTGSLAKGLIMAVGGIALSTIGQDPVSGITRFTMGSITLMDGVGLVPVAMGVFGVGEVLTNIEESIKQEVFAAKISGLFPTVKDWIDCKWPIVRGTLFGFFLGILPGAGTVIPTFMSYATEKRLSKHPEKFGNGAIEGVAAPETANNAATGGSMVTLLSLGIPPNVGMAILLGAFIIHGIQPGPLLLTKHPQLFWGTIASMYIGNVMLVVLNLPLIGIWVKLLKVPYNILFPLILLFCFLGVYSLNNNLYEILVMVGFGIFGYLMRKFGFEGAPFLLAMVLGPMLEIAFRQSLLYGDPFIFFKRPISAILLAITFVLLISSIIPRVTRKRKVLGETLRLTLGLPLTIIISSGGNRMKTYRVESKIAFSLCVLLALIPLLTGPGYAQEDVAKFPARPITFIIPIPPGGASDASCRLISKEAEKFLGQPIVCLNKPGGSFAIAIAAIASSNPDGYTIGYAGHPGLFVTPLTGKVPYHPVKDLKQIMQYGYLNIAVTVKGDSPFKKFADVVVYARQNPKKLTYGSAGVGSFGHLGMEEIARREKVQFTHIPFKGSPETQVALLGGHILVATGDFNYSQLEAEQIRLLFLIGEERSPDYPQTPILKDLGYDIPAPTFLNVAGPKGMPDGIVKKLEDAFTKAMKEPAFIKGMKDLRLTIAYRNNKEMDDYVARNVEAFSRLLKEIGLIK